MAHAVALKRTLAICSGSDYALGSQCRLDLGQLVFDVLKPLVHVIFQIFSQSLYFAYGFILLVEHLIHLGIHAVHLGIHAVHLGVHAVHLGIHVIHLGIYAIKAGFGDHNEFVDARHHAF